MERAEIRLKVLELAVKGTSSHTEAMARFEEYFKTVMELGSNEKSPGTPTAGVGVTVGKNDSRPGKG